MAKNTGYGMNAALQDWLAAKAGGLPGANLPVRARNVKLYSSKNILIGGDAPRRLKFFDEPAGPFIQTIIGQNQLPANMALSLQAVRFGFVPGLDREGRRLGLNSPTTAQKLLSAISAGGVSATGADTIATQWKWAETIREFMSSPLATFGTSTDEIWAVRSLLALPDGKASLVQAGTSQASTSATASGTQDVFQSISNGIPSQQNRWGFSGPWPMAGNEVFGMEVIWPRQVDFADADIGPLAGQTDVVAGTLTCEFEGELAIAQ